MRTIIDDLKENELKKIKFNKEDILISSINCNKHCIGCFSCWIKHPKKCALNDDFSNMTELLRESDEFIIISKCRYGCYSSSTKKVLERCIGYVLPYFTIRNNEIHHACRYERKLKFKTYFYGDITEKDKMILNKLIKANAININAKSYKVICINNIKELQKCIL